MADRTIGSQLGQLALALVNATLMLAVLLVFGLWLLLGRAQDFATDTARAAAAAIGADLGGAVAGQAASLKATVGRLSTLDDQLRDAAARAGTVDSAAATELAALRGDVQALTEAVGGLNDTATALSETSSAAVADVLRQVLTDLAARLGPAVPAPPAN
jgi:hypothetical protein